MQKVRESAFKLSSVWFQSFHFSAFVVRGKDRKEIFASLPLPKQGLGHHDVSTLNSDLEKAIPYSLNPSSGFPPSSFPPNFRASSY
jgi:hypothetical protein